MLHAAPTTRPAQVSQLSQDEDVCLQQAEPGTVPQQDQVKQPRGVQGVQGVQHQAAERI